MTLVIVSSFLFTLFRKIEILYDRLIINKLGDGYEYGYNYFNQWINEEI